MTLVKFAVVCDLCGTRGEEYGGGYSCDDCMRDVCEDCSAWYVDGTTRALCWDCDLLSRPLYQRILIRAELFIGSRLWRLRVAWRKARGLRWTDIGTGDHG